MNFGTMDMNVKNLSEVKWLVRLYVVTCMYISCLVRCAAYVKRTEYPLYA